MIHIVGASGYIGKKLESYLINLGFEDLRLYSEVNSDKYKKINLIDIDNSNLSDFKKDDIVILLAAISSPDVCETNYQLARSINVLGTSKLINICFQRKIKVLFFSSDIVYGFNKGINDENTKPNPSGNYAKMKYEIEEIFKENPLFKVFRLSYVLSDEDKFISYIKKTLVNGEIPEIFNGLYRNVIHIDDVLLGILKIIENFYIVNSSIINMCGQDLLSRVDLAKIYFNNQINNWKVIDVPEEMLKTRPNIIQTQSLYIEKILGRKPRKI